MPAPLQVLLENPHIRMENKYIYCLHNSGTSVLTPVKSTLLVKSKSLTFFSIECLSSPSPIKTRVVFLFSSYISLKTSIIKLWFLGSLNLPI